MDFLASLIVPIEPTDLLPPFLGIENPRVAALGFSCL